MRVSGKPLVRYSYNRDVGLAQFAPTQRVRSQVGVFVQSMTTSNGCTNLTVTEGIGPTKRT